MMERHTFAICAYKESPFLEECICSLKNQTQQSLIIMITSTPNEHIKNLVERYNIPLYVNTGESGITQDWNFAYSMTNTELVTIAHQDDVYLPDYTKEIYRVISSVKHPLIAFTNYGELREGQPVLNNSLLRIKRFALWLLRFPVFQNSRFIRRRILSLGNMICCPAVTFVKNNLPEQVFKHNFRSNEDWEAWEALSRNKGAFAYSPKIEMYHRIHGGSETSAILGDHARSKEDYEMFCKLWPAPVARLITKIYAKSEESNKLQ